MVHLCAALHTIPLTKESSSYRQTHAMSHMKRYNPGFFLHFSGLVALLPLCSAQGLCLVTGANRIAQLGPCAGVGPTPVGSPQSAQAVITVGGATATIASSGGVITLPGAPPITVMPGVPVTIGSDTISLGPGGVIMNGQTSTFETVAVPGNRPSPLSPAPIFGTVTSDGTTIIGPLTVLFVTGTAGAVRGQTTPVTFIESSTDTTSSQGARETSFSGSTWKCIGGLCRPHCLFPLIPLLCPDSTGGGGGGFPPPPLGQPLPGPPGGSDEDEECESTATVP